MFQNSSQMRRIVHNHQLMQRELTSHDKILTIIFMMAAVKRLCSYPFLLGDQFLRRSYTERFV